MGLFNTLLITITMSHNPRFTFTSYENVNTMNISSISSRGLLFTTGHLNHLAYVC